MLFHEIYGSYYRVTAKVLQLAAEKKLTAKLLTETVQEMAFSESILTLPGLIRGQEWMLLDQNLQTPIQNVPDLPLTVLEKRFLKSLLSDPRIQLFSPETEGLSDVEPLFDADTFYYFDRYLDGDPYTDPSYIQNFKTVLTALKEKRYLYLSYHGKGGVRSFCVLPLQLEYSPKDDKFRLLAFDRKYQTINLSRILDCSMGQRAKEPSLPPRAKETVVLSVTDVKNALDRVMLHFSHLEKETVRLDKDRYRMTLRYDPEDETEMVIRILSFGSAVKVLEPDDMIQRIKQRIEKQMQL